MQTKPEITMSDFEKIDIRVGTILRALDIENSRSIVELRVDFGDEVRTILASSRTSRRSSSRIWNRAK